MLTLKHCTLTHRMGETATNADVSVTTTRATMDQIVMRKLTIPDALASGALKLEGEIPKLGALFAMMDPPAGMMFEILTPGEGR